MMSRRAFVQAGPLALANEFQYEVAALVQLVKCFNSSIDVFCCLQVAISNW